MGSSQQLRAVLVFIQGAARGDPGGEGPLPPELQC